MRKGSSSIELHGDNTPAITVCSGRWDADIFSHFGGLAPLAMQHHICLTRRVIIQSDEGFGDVWDDDGVKSMRRLDVNLDVALLRPALHEAIQFVRDERRDS